MYKINIITIGKIKEQWLSGALKEYEKRMQNIALIQWHLLKNDQSLIKALEKAKNVILLDEHGQEFSSEKFSCFLHESLEKNKSSISFVIGGSSGFPIEIKNKKLKKISFSKMTLTHQMIRLFLLEQIYRSFEINKNSNYHK